MSFKNFIDVNTKTYKLNTIEKANVIFWCWNIVNNKLYLSDETKANLGYDNSDLDGGFDKWQHIWHHDEQSRMLKIIQSNIRANKDEFSMLQKFIHKNQISKWYYSKAMIIKNENNKPIEIHGFSVNADDLIKIYRYLNLEENDYMDYISATNTGTWYWNVETNETTFNDRWAQMLGYAIEELKPISLKTWESLVHKDDIKQAKEALNKVIENNEAFYENTFRMVHKDGSDVWILDRGKIIEWTDNEKPLVMMGTHNDITKHKLLEQQLAKDEERYKNLVESSYDIIYSIDLNNNITYISSAWTRRLGHPVEDVLNKSFIPYVHKDDIKKLQNFFDDIKNSNKRLELRPYRLKHKDGSWRYFSTNAVSIKNDLQEVIGYSGTARDITKQVSLEEELLKEREMFKKTLLSVGEGIISTDQYGKVVVLNPVAQRFVSLRSKDTKGKSLEEIFIVYQHDTHKLIGNIALEVINSGKPISFREGILTNLNQEKIHIEYSASPIEDIHGVKDGVVIVFRDISDRIERQKEIEYLSYHDYLTGLYNRRYYEQYIKQLDETDKPISMMLLDINDLKKFNDTFGHDAGDQLIKVVSDVLQDLADDAVVCRSGGDEFILVYEKDVDLLALEDKIKLTLNKIELYGREVSVSIGFNKRLDKYDRLVDIQKRADMYLYECKHRFHNNTK